MSAQNSNVAIVIAAYNESKVIRSVVTNLLALDYQVIVVDDGSTDGTAAQLAGSAALVCRHAINLGQGAALQTGIQLALGNGAEYVVTFDADGQHDPQSIAALLKPLREGAAQAALGTRFAPGGSAIDIPHLKRWLLGLAILFTRISYGIKVTDTHNGLRAFTRAAASRLNITQNRMAHATQILAQIHAANLKYCEVPVEIRYTQYSKQKGQKISNFFNILWEMLEGLFGL